MKFSRKVVVGCLLLCGGAAFAATPQYFKDLQSKKVASSPALKWTNFGPGMSGYCDELFVHPTDPNGLYMNLDMGNSYYTHDGAQSWITMQDWDTDGEGKRPVWMEYSYQNPDFGFALDEKGNLRKTLDRGKTWVQTKSFGRKHSVISVDPNNDSNWYIGAGQYWRVKGTHRSINKLHGTQYRNTNYGHIYVSKDKGANWTKVTDNFNANLDVAKIFVDPTDSDVVFAYTNYGFYKSIDGGYKWTKKGSGLPYNEPRDGDWYYDKNTGKYVLYLVEQTHYKGDGDADSNGKESILTTGGVYKSVDHGETWTSVTGNLAINLNKINLSNAEKGYYRTIAHWLNISESVAKSRYPQIPSSTFTVFNRVVSSKTDPNVFFVSNNTKHDYSFGPGDIWRTSDGGATWVAVARHGKYWVQQKDKAYWQGRKNPLGMNMKYAHLDHEMRDYDMTPGTRMLISNSNGDLYIVHEQQILRSIDNGENWQQVDDDETSPGSGYWVGRGGSNLPGESLQLETGSDKYLFCSGEHGLWRSAPGGDDIKKGRVAVEQLSGQSKKPYDATSICAAAVHPDDPDKIYMLMFRQFERGRVRRSADGGKTWSNISYPVKSSTSLSPEENKIAQYDLMFDKEDPDTMFFCVPYTRWVAYVSTLWERNGPSDFSKFGVYKSTDGGFNWSLANNGLPAGVSVQRLEMDPADSKTMYAALNKVNISGQPVTNGGLYKTVNGGGGWTKVTIPSEIQGVNHVHVDKTNGYLYISAGEYKGDINRGGVWVSKDTGQNWTKLFYMPFVRECYSSDLNEDVLLVNVGRGQKISSRNTGVFYSTDGGASWAKGNYQLGQPGRIKTLRPDPNNENIFYAGLNGSGWYKGVLSDNEVRAMADNLYIYEGETGTLDASGSFGSGLSYSWNAPADISLASKTDKTTTFTAPFVDADTRFKVTLSVSNAEGSDEMEIWITVRNRPGAVDVTDTASFAAAPAQFLNTDVLSFDVDYVASEERHIAVVLWSPTNSYITNRKKIVPAGSGTVTIDVDLADPLPVGENYKVTCDVRPVSAPGEEAIKRQEHFFNLISKPYGGNALSVPGVIEAEDYDNGGEGRGYHDIDPANKLGQYRTDGVDIQVCSEGGYNVGYVATGEWLEYTIAVEETADYDFIFRTAASALDGAVIVKLNGSEIIDSTVLPKTGSWQTYRNTTVSRVSLSAGEHTMRIYVDNGGFNFDKVSIEKSVINYNPIVTMTSPEAGTVINRGEALTVSGSASVQGSTITEIRLLSNGSQIKKTTSPDYQFTLKSLTAGNYIFTIIAVAENGLESTISESITVNEVATISLVEGYQLISLNIVPETKDIQSLFAPYLGNIEFIQDQNKKKLYKDEAGDWVNDIGVWNSAQAYLVKASGTTPITVTDSGNLISAADYSKAGIYLIPIRAELSKPLQDHFPSIIDRVEWIRCIDGQSMRKIDNQWVNSIDSITAGSGVIVKLRAE